MKKFIAALLIGFTLTLPSPALAGIGATTVWEFQTGGSDSNGGGYTSGGVDYSTSTTQQATITTLSVVAATTTDITVSPTDYVTSSSDIGNIYYNSGGSSTAGFYEIMSIPVAGTWRLDRSIGTAAQTCTGRMGGARKLLSSNSFAAALVAGNTVWVKSGTYATAAFSSMTNGSSTAPIVIEGYNSTRGDLPTIASGNQPLLTMGNNAFTVGTFCNIKNITFTTSVSTGIVLGANSKIRNCKITSTNATSTNNALALFNGSHAIQCEVINASGRGINASDISAIADSCYVHDSFIGLRSVAATTTFTNCIVDTCTTAVLLAGGTALKGILENCTLYGAETPAGVGIDATVDHTWIFKNNIIYGFTTGALWTTNMKDNNVWTNNNFFNNTTARTLVTAGATDIALDPTFTNAAGGDFSVGTNMKAVGYPGAFPGGLSTGYMDIGAVQRQEAGGIDILGAIT